MLIELSTSLIDKTFCYSGLGFISFALEQYDEALIYHQKELDFKIKLDFMDEGIANVYFAMGQNYLRKNELDLALLYEQKALEKLPPTEYRELSNIYGVMGNIYMNKSNYDLAKKYYEKSLELDRNYLPSNHENVAVTYAKLGTMYARKADYKQALDYFIKAHDIYLKCLPPNHPYTVGTEKKICILKIHLNKK